MEFSVLFALHTISLCFSHDDAWLNCPLSDDVHTNGIAVALAVIFCRHLSVFCPLSTVYPSNYPCVTYLCYLPFLPLV